MVNTYTLLLKVYYGRGSVPPGKVCTLYDFKIIGTDIHKIGITSRTLNERYRTAFDRDQMEVLLSIKCKTCTLAYELEQYLIKKYSKYRYKGTKIMTNGNTELFTHDVMKISKYGTSKVEGYLTAKADAIEADRKAN